jgi:hypothetical protein
VQFFSKKVHFLCLRADFEGKTGVFDLRDNQHPAALREYFYNNTDN